MNPTVRRASPADAPLLSEIALRAKASWGYTRAFMERVRSALAVSADYVGKSPVYVLLDRGTIVGFFGFSQQSGETVLSDFWIDAPAIGNGYGRAMWRHAVKRARANAYRSFLIHSDPNAEGFYLHMGAERVGTRIAPESGREVPLLRYELTATAVFRT